MRKLRVVMSTGGAVPALAVTLLVVAEGACGGESVSPAADASAAIDAAGDASLPQEDVLLIGTSDARESAPPERCNQQQYIVDLPAPGVPADPGQLCSVTPAPAESNTAARVTLTSYDPTTETAKGFIAIPPTLRGAVIGVPTITVATADRPEFKSMSISSMQQTAGGFTFHASFPALPHQADGARMMVKTSFALACEGGAQTVESLTRLDFCADGDSFGWVSSGDACTVCRIIAEMAPSPIVPDAHDDDLPLARVIRIRVVEIARTSDMVLLFAENDGGTDASYEWRVSGGTIEQLAPDLLLWTVPTDSESPHGQVAIWNDHGAVVENFVWGAA